VINTASNMVTATIALPKGIDAYGGSPYGVAVTPNGAYVYVTNANNHSVSVIDTASNMMAETVTVGGNPKGVAVTPDGAYVYVIGSGSSQGRVWVIVNQLTITVTQGANGVITPETTTVNYGGSQSFTITPNPGYHITSLTVDGSAVAAAASYTFSNVTVGHSITATYELTPTPTPKLTATPTPTVTSKPTQFPSSTPTIPEFPSWIILLMLSIIVTTGLLVYFKKRKR
jgi:YVTN family beta-propeller protein